MATEVENTFVITIKQEGETNQISAHAGNVTIEPLPFPSTEELLSAEQRKLLQSLSNETANASPAEIQALGHTLYNALFPIPIAVAYGQSQRPGQNDGATRLCLQIDPPELAALPWEALHDGRDWLALNPTAPLVRRLALGEAAQVLNKLQVKGAVSILFVGASPEDQPKLDIAAALQSLQERLQEPISKKQILLDSLLNPTLDQLREQLLKDYHILYFSGHGSPQGIFVNDGFDGSQPVSAETLAQALEGKATRLVYLAACNTSAKTNPQDGLLLEGFAQDLAERANLPAIVAMQYYLSNMNANTMSGHFFAALAQFRPVDVALAEARTAAVVEDAVGRDVLAPVMYLQAHDGTLFQQARNWPFLIALLALLVASGIGSYFWWQRNVVQVEKEWAAAVGLSRQLAVESENAFATQEPELRLLLAVEAISTTRRVRGTVTTQAEAALYHALAAPFRGRQPNTSITEQEVKTYADSEVPSHLWSLVNERTRGLNAEYWTNYGLMAEYSFADTIRLISFNPDETKFVTVGCGNILVTGDCPSWSAHLWQINGEPDHWRLDGHIGDVIYASFIADGSFIITISEGGTAQLWDEEGNLQARMEGVVKDVARAYGSSNGRAMTTISLDGVARLWTFDGDLLNHFRISRTLDSATYSPDGTTLIVAGRDAPFPEFYTPQGQQIGGHDLAFRNWSHEAIVSPDGEKILTTHLGNKVALWDKAGNLQFHFDIGDTNIKNSVLNSASFDHAGLRFVTASIDNTIQVWDAQDSKLLVTIPDVKQIVAVGFSADDTSIIAADSNGAVKVWDAKKGTLLKTLIAIGPASTIRFEHQNNRMISLGSDGTVAIWNTQDGSLIYRLDHLDRNASSVDFSSSGEQLVTGGEDGLVRLWNAASGNLLATYSGIGGAISVVQFSPDDQRLLATGVNGDVREWRIWHDLDAMLAEATNRAGRKLTSAECQQYLKLEQCP